MSWLTGRHAIESAISQNRNGDLYLTREPRNEMLAQRAIEKSIRVKWVEHSELRTLTSSDQTRGAAFYAFERDEPKAGSRISVADFVETAAQKDHALVVILDHISDPHNLGAILRSADLFRVDLVVVPDRRSVHVTDTVSRASAGASGYVPVTVEKNLARTLDDLKDAGFWIYGADMGHETSYGVSFAAKSAIILGSEGKGISPLIRKKSDLLVSIPTAGHIDSLNVSVTAGILLYEFRRQFPV